MVMIGSLLVSCKGDGTLLDLYPREPIVNPDVRTLIQGNRIVYAQLDGRSQIRGITDGGRFTTYNRFKSFGFDPYSWQGEQGVTGFGEGLVVQAMPEGASFVLRYSSDMGVTWVSYDTPIVDDDDIVLGAVHVVQLLVGADGSVWLLAQQNIGMDRRMLLYHVDLWEEKSVLLLRRDKAIALTADFANHDDGWLLYSDQDGETKGVHVLKTVNGGQVWSAGATLGNLNQPSIEAIADDRLLVYPQTGQALLSADGGDSFTPVSIGDNGISICHAASPDVVYALLVNGVAKSIDGGQTWLRLDAQAYDVDISGMAMDFYNERQGIVYDWNKLFITDDGGASWDILIYPYDYLLE
ncbi:hypothetical protein SAMN05421740_10727 [Parapedobacter koreensis]|uniref:BNR/Asp-box repeat-containing protein n=2 Tax=Parapedobacter koreensis TaxID=332977 RepID=A0A1H7REN4_9SPHI|nr:hypothetical protein SAMN05421740_10727 [Parapedobacter koreensis]